MSDSSPVYHQVFFTVHTANLYDIYHCCAYSEKLLMIYMGNHPKHVEFYSKNEFGKLVDLIGFIVRVYHDARSLEHQMRGCIQPKVPILVLCQIRVKYSKNIALEYCSVIFMFSAVIIKADKPAIVSLYTVVTI